MSQTDQILMAMKRGKTLTHLQALREFRCARLAARIAELRDAGHPIKTVMIPTRDNKRIAQYHLEEQSQ